MVCFARLTAHPALLLPPFPPPRFPRSRPRTQFGVNLRTATAQNIYVDVLLSEVNHDLKRLLKGATELPAAEAVDPCGPAGPA